MAAYNIKDKLGGVKILSSTDPFHATGRVKTPLRSVELVSLRSAVGNTGRTRINSGVLDKLLDSITGALSKFGDWSQSEDGQKIQNELADLYKKFAENGGKASAPKIHNGKIEKKYVDPDGNKFHIVTIPYDDNTSDIVINLNRFNDIPNDLIEETVFDYIDNYGGSKTEHGDDDEILYVPGSRGKKKKKESEKETGKNLIDKPISGTVSGNLKIKEDFVESFTVTDNSIKIKNVASDIAEALDNTVSNKIKSLVKDNKYTASGKAIGKDGNLLFRIDSIKTASAVASSAQTSGRTRILASTNPLPKTQTDCEGEWELIDEGDSISGQVYCGTRPLRHFYSFNVNWVMTSFEGKMLFRIKPQTRHASVESRVEKLLSVSIGELIDNELYENNLMESVNIEDGVIAQGSASCQGNSEVIFQIDSILVKESGNSEITSSAAESQTQELVGTKSLEGVVQSTGSMGTYKGGIVTSMETFSLPFSVLLWQGELEMKVTDKNLVLPYRVKESLEQTVFGRINNELDKVGMLETYYKNVKTLTAQGTVSCDNGQVKYEINSIQAVRNSNDTAVNSSSDTEYWLTWTNPAPTFDTQGREEFPERYFRIVRAWDSNAAIRTLERDNRVSRKWDGVTAEPYTPEARQKLVDAGYIDITHGDISRIESSDPPAKYNEPDFFLYAEEEGECDICGKTVYDNESYRRDGRTVWHTECERKEAAGEWCEQCGNWRSECGCSQ